MYLGSARPTCIHLSVPLDHVYTMYITTISGFPEDYERTSVCSEQQLLLVLPTGDCIFSTNEICRFLCSECGQDKLCGDSPEDQALIDHWLGWEASELKVQCNQILCIQPYGVVAIGINHCYCNTTFEVSEYYLPCI